MNALKDYYKILGVNINADAIEIKRAYHKLALEWHPDRNNSPDAHEKFIEIVEAYEILSDTEARKQYDFFRAQSNDENSNRTAYRTYESKAESAQKKAAQYANMRYEEFKKTLYVVVKTTGFQLSQLILNSLGAIFIISGIGNIIVGNKVLGLVIAPVGFYLWNKAQQRWNMQ